jgi:hypothetical protein
MACPALFCLHSHAVAARHHHHHTCTPHLHVGNTNSTLLLRSHLPVPQAAAAAARASPQCMWATCRAPWTSTCWSAPLPLLGQSHMSRWALVPPCCLLRTLCCAVGMEAAAVCGCRRSCPHPPHHAHPPLPTLSIPWPRWSGTESSTRRHQPAFFRTHALLPVPPFPPLPLPSPAGHQREGQQCEPRLRLCQLRPPHIRNCGHAAHEPAGGRWVGGWVVAWMDGGFEEASGDDAGAVATGVVPARWPLCLPALVAHEHRCWAACPPPPPCP